MVKKKRKLKMFLLVFLSASLCMGGCRRSDSPFNPPERTENTEVSGDGSPGAGEASGETSGKGKNNGTLFGHDLSGSGEEDASGIVIQGPDLPPDGQRYDEWKGFQYTTETSFPVRTYWAIGSFDGRSGAAAGFYQNPEHIEDGVLEIVDAKAEPVGGEMELRSGGYVDITIETRWTGTMNFTTDDEFNTFGTHISWGDNEVLPCDAYTGTSLLNYSGEGSENDSINIGEAYDTGMVESDITWKDRTYRLFAKSDKRNSSFGETSYRYAGSSVSVTEPGAVETTYTLRVPADYDGMVLAIDKDITDEKADHIDDRAEFLPSSDTYADILTTDTGVRQTADDYYFVRVSDLLEIFRSRNNT